MSAYAELAVTTNFSFLRGASDPEELVGAAQALGLAGSASPIATASPAWCARTPRRGRTRPRRRLKLAVGARLVFADGTPDILAYPRDRAAWGRLTRLLSLGKRRAEKGDCILGLDDLLDHIEGLNLIVMPGRLGRRASPLPLDGERSARRSASGVRVSVTQSRVHPHPPGFTRRPLPSRGR